MAIGTRPVLRPAPRASSNCSPPYSFLFYDSASSRPHCCHSCVLFPSSHAFYCCRCSTFALHPLPYLSEAACRPIRSIYSISKHGKTKEVLLARRGNVMLLVRLLLFGVLVGAAVSHTRLFKYGENNGDQEITHSLTSSALQLQVPVRFYEQLYTDLYISPLGAVSFDESLDENINEALENVAISAIAPLFARSNGGRIFYRSTSADDELLADMTSRVGKHFGNFHANHAVVVTWEGMTKEGSEAENTFQLGIATDGESSYAFLLYSEIEWVESNDQYAQAGFYHSEGRHQLMINSGTANFVQMSRTSNINSDGIFLYRISGDMLQDPRNENEDDDDYNYNDYDYEAADSKTYAFNDCPPDPYKDMCPVRCHRISDDRGCTLCVCPHPPAVNPVTSEPEQPEIKEVEAPVQPEPEVEQNVVAEQEPIPAETQQTDERIAHAGTCAESTEQCNPNAVCVDYSNGFCCECRPEFYGNGKECLSKKNPQRISGFFSGVINGRQVTQGDSPNVHTYVAVEKAIAYTAVDSIPTDIGRQLMILSPVGSVMGWLFAKVNSPNEYNGFDLTGGLFNRSVTIHLGDRYKVAIRQEFAGRHIQDYYSLKTTVTGTLPEVPEGAEILFDDHEEEYRREGSGYVRSYAIQNIRILRPDNQHENLQMSVDQLIQYKECPFKTFDKAETVRMRVKQVKSQYEPENQLVRFGMQYTTGEEEPTHQHRPRDPHQHQVNQEEQQTDPCAPGQHLCTEPNMRCQVEAPSYRCVCDRGFAAVADANAQVGYSCQDLDECHRGDHNCDRNAECRNLPGTFECVCREGFYGDGYFCQGEGEEVPQEGEDNSVHEAAAPVHPQQPHQPVAQPSEGCTTHQQCHEYGECVFGRNGQPGYCKCRGWYVGDGVNHCGPPEQEIVPQTEPEHRVETNSCDSATCDVNADCNPSPSGGYECVCRAGFHGNGLQCESLSGDQEPAVEQCYSHEECGENAYCKLNEELDVYQCACRDRHSRKGGACVKDHEDECQSHEACGQNGVCYFNQDHHFYQCKCREGTEMIGGICTRPSTEPGVGCDTLHNCDRNAHCVFSPHQNRHVCQCASGFHGDGLRCASLGDDQEQYREEEARRRYGEDERRRQEEEERRRQDEEERRRQHQMQITHRHQCRDAKDCHHNAHCVIDEQTNSYVCECLPGFSGDGRDQCQSSDRCNPAHPGSCPQHAECVLGEVERAFVCKCISGFTGNGMNCRAQGLPSTCEDNPSLCHTNAQCVYIQEQGTHGCICKPGFFGDGYTDCTVKDQPRCGKCSTNARCIQDEETEAWNCQCNPGFQGNGLFCQPMTSCLDNKNICDEHAECVPGVGGHYVCNCLYGYHGNGRTCAPDSDARADTLLISRGMSIIQRGTNVDIPGKHLLIVPHQTVIDIEVDCQGDRIYWSDASGHSLRSSSMNGTNLETYLSDVLKFPEGIAIDWASRNIYYADSVKDVIGVASLDGKMHKMLISEGLVNTRDLAIDLNDRRLYYADWNREHPIIGRMDLDGSNNEIFLEDDIQLPNGIVIVHSRRELCWLDAGTKKLSCVGTDRSNRRVVFSALEHPFGLAIHNEQRFYWTDWKDKKVHSVSIYGQGYTSFATSIGTSANLFGITAVNKQCLGVPTSCANNNGGCEHLCLPGRTAVKCVCPDNTDC